MISPAQIFKKIYGEKAVILRKSVGKKVEEVYTRNVISRLLVLYSTDTLFDTYGVDVSYDMKSSDYGYKNGQRAFNGKFPGERREIFLEKMHSSDNPAQNFCHAVELHKKHFYDTYIGLNSKDGKQGATKKLSDNCRLLITEHITSYNSDVSRILLSLLDFNKPFSVVAILLIIAIIQDNLGEGSEIKGWITEYLKEVGGSSTKEACDYYSDGRYFNQQIFSCSNDNKVFSTEKASYRFDGNKATGNPPHILVEGKGGMGKTVLSKGIYEIFRTAGTKEFSHVFRIPLVSLVGRIDTTGDKENLGDNSYYNFNEKIKAKFGNSIKELVHTVTTPMLLILDGFDELAMTGTDAEVNCICNEIKSLSELTIGNSENNFTFYIIVFSKPLDSIKKGDYNSVFEKFERCRVSETPKEMIDKFTRKKSQKKTRKKACTEEDDAYKVDEGSKLHKLLSYPLYYGMLSKLKENKKSMPTTRYEVFDITYMCGLRQASEKIGGIPDSYYYTMYFILLPLLGTMIDYKKALDRIEITDAINNAVEKVKDNRIYYDAIFDKEFEEYYSDKTSLEISDRSVAPSIRIDDIDWLTYMCAEGFILNNGNDLYEFQHGDWHSFLKVRYIACQIKYLRSICGLKTGERYSRQTAAQSMNFNLPEDSKDMLKEYLGLSDIDDEAKIIEHIKSTMEDKFKTGEPETIGEVVCVVKRNSFLCKLADTFGPKLYKRDGSADLLGEYLFEELNTLCEIVKQLVDQGETIPEAIRSCEKELLSILRKYIQLCRYKKMYQTGIKYVEVCKKILSDSQDTKELGYLENQHAKLYLYYAQSLYLGDDIDESEYIREEGLNTAKEFFDRGHKLLQENAEENNSNMSGNLCAFLLSAPAPFLVKNEVIQGGTDYKRAFEYYYNTVYSRHGYKGADIVYSVTMAVSLILFGYIKITGITKNPLSVSAPKLTIERAKDFKGRFTDDLSDESYEVVKALLDKVAYYSSDMLDFCRNYYAYEYYHKKESDNVTKREQSSGTIAGMLMNEKSDVSTFYAVIKVFTGDNNEKNGNAKKNNDAKKAFKEGYMDKYLKRFFCGIKSDGEGILDIDHRVNRYLDFKFLVKKHFDTKGYPGCSYVEEKEKEYFKNEQETLELIRLMEGRTTTEKKE